MKLFKKLVLLITIYFATNSYSQIKKTEPNGYKITIATQNLQKEKLLFYMAYGTGRQMVIVDSTTIKTNDQKVVFKKDDRVLGVIYFLKLASQKNEIGLAIDNNSQVNLSLDNKNIETINCISKGLNEDFINYQILQKSNTAQQQSDLRKKLIGKYPNSIFDLYLKIDRKTLETKPENEVQKIAFRNNFWSFMDKNDKRNFLLPNIYGLMYSYVNILPITNENYIKNIDLLMNGIDCNSKNYAIYIKWFISNLSYYESKQIDKSYNYLYKTYIEANKCKTFTDAEISGFRSRYDKNILLPFNSIIPDVPLINKELAENSLSKIYPEADFTFLAFFSPTCHHCQETMPVASTALQALKAKYPNKKIQLISVLNDADESQWEQFIIERKLATWQNWKPNDKTRKYQTDLHAVGNPNFYFLDKKGAILLKTFNAKAIEEILKEN